MRSAGRPSGGSWNPDVKPEPSQVVSPGQRRRLKPTSGYATAHAQSDPATNGKFGARYPVVAPVTPVRPAPVSSQYLLRRPSLPAL